MRQTARATIMITLATIAVAITVPRTFAAEFEWKFFTHLPANDRPVQLDRAFVEDIFKASNGRLKITVFTAGELPYKPADAARIVSSNQVQMSQALVGAIAGDVAEINVFSLPFLCTSYDQFHRALVTVRPIVDSVMAQRFGVVVGLHWTAPPQNLWLNRPASKLEDLKNMKIRIWNPEQSAMLAQLGASAVAISSAEVIPALERRVIDGAITSAMSANDWRAYELIKVGLMLSFTMGHHFIMINQAEFNRLPADLQKLLLAKNAEWEPKYRAMSEESETTARVNLQKHGVTLKVLPASDIEKARRIMRPRWDSWAADHKAVGQELVQKVVAACTQQ